MTELVIFVALVGVVAGGGIALGMIAAKRIDQRLIAADERPAEEPEQASAPAADMVEEGPVA